MKTIILTLLTFSILSGSPTYTNCDFKLKSYENLCKASVKKGISVQYVNEFLLSKKTKARDFKSFRLFHPSMIKKHSANEKRANNSLIAFVPKIVQHLRDYKEVYDAVEAKYHVNREVIAAIFAKETRLGLIKPGHDAFTVFNTLLVESQTDSKREKRLVRMAHNNMISIMQFCFKSDIMPDSCNFQSSYAGAVAIPQFMPQNFHYIEGYQKSIGDLTDMSDAIMSAGKFLQNSAKFTQMMEWNKIPNMKEVENDWYDYDFDHDNASFAYAASKRSGKKYNCYACDKSELDYLSGYTKIIMRYNNSSNYAIGVLRLAYDAHQSLQ